MYRAFFWNRIANRYARQPVADEAAYQQKLQRTRDVFHPDMLVLEFGCGTGSTAIAHAPFVKHINAIDFSSKMIEIARRKAVAAGIENVSFEQLTLDDLDPSDQSLDAVLGMSILHLLPNKDAVIAQVFAMLKPGGVFVSSTACLGDTMRYFRFIAPLMRPLGLRPQVFSVLELVDSVAAAGFQIEHQWQPGSDPSVFIIARKPAPN